ncbi:MAG: hypothetical protein AAGJ40_04590 [Planctomycetota bacterium]
MSWLGQLESLTYLAILKANSKWTWLRRRFQTGRGAMATLAVVAFVVLYVVGGVTVLGRREPTDPESLRRWLSGGMVLYALFHAIKQIWSSDFDQAVVGSHRDSPADRLWLGGGPLHRSMLVGREFITVVPATIAKSLLLLVVLQGDVASRLQLAIGVFLSLLTLELVRRVISSLIASMSAIQRTTMKAISLAIVTALFVHLGSVVYQIVPNDPDPVDLTVCTLAGIGELAQSSGIQSLATPLMPAAHVASQQTWTIAVPLSGLFVVDGWMCWLLAIGMLPIWMMVLVSADSWSLNQRCKHERVELDHLTRTLANNVSQRIETDSLGADLVSRFVDRCHGLMKLILPKDVHVDGCMGIVLRQLHCLVRYRSHVMMSLGIPTLLSLSPLVMEQSAKQWLFCVGGILLSSILLAPPALQIDFRRDLRRMGLLKSLPMTSWSMCIGMLSVPVIMTILFQWLTVTVACIVVPTAFSRWISLMLAMPAVAVLTFAIENALFLIFPHSIGAQGIGMVLRTKVMFLWKAVVIAAFPTSIALIAALCSTCLPETVAQSAAVFGILVSWWAIAIVSLFCLTGCWQRFDPVRDIAPE